MDIVGSLTLLATILLANDSNILNSILDFIKNFFSKIHIIKVVSCTRTCTSDY